MMLVEDKMITKEYTEDLKITQEIINKYEMMDIAYFDIETTGFDKEKDKVILISLGFFNEDSSFSVKQFFSGSVEEEKQILVEFKNELKEFKTWCSYNGMAFDEPFINRRMQFNRIDFNSPNVHFDLYRKIRCYQKQLGIERCNLKSVEKFIGIERKDQIDGSISVKLYEEYLTTKEEELRDIIMLHNYEDVISLPKIYKLARDVGNN